MRSGTFPGNPCAGSGVRRSTLLYDLAPNALLERNCGCAVARPRPIHENGTATRQAHRRIHRSPLIPEQQMALILADRISSAEAATPLFRADRRLKLRPDGQLRGRLRGIRKDAGVWR